MGIIKFKNGIFDKKSSKEADSNLKKEILGLYYDKDKYKSAKLESFSNKCKVINELYGYNSEYSTLLINQLKVDFNNDLDISL